MRHNLNFAFSLAFLLLLGSGASAWAQDGQGSGAQVAPIPAATDRVVVAASQDANEAAITADKPSSVIYDGAQEAQAKGHIIISNSEIQDERDAVEQLERSVTGRSTFDINAMDSCYTLQQSIDSALEKHPSIRQAKENIAQAEARYRQSDSYLNSQLTVANKTTVQPEWTYRGQKATEHLSDVLSVSLGKVLTTFGQLENKVAAAYLQIGVDKLHELAAERSLAFEVKQAFFNRLKADAIVDVALLNLGLTKESLTDANKMFKQGVMARFDVIQSELQVVQATEQLAKANTNVDVANASLADLLCVSRLDEPVRIGLEKPNDITVDDNCTLADLKRLSAQRRFEILALDRSREVLEKTRASASASNRPEIGISGDYIFSPGIIGTPLNILQLNFNIKWAAWDGGERRARLDEIDSQLRALDDSRESTLKNIHLAVEKAWLDFQLTEVMIQTAKERVEAAWTFHDMARQRFLNGLGTSLEVRDALTHLNNAREAFVATCYDRDLAFAKLEYCVGVDFPNRHLAVTTDMFESLDDKTRE